MGACTAEQWWCWSVGALVGGGDRYRECRGRDSKTRGERQISLLVRIVVDR